MKINVHAVPDAGLELTDDISAEELGLDTDEIEVVGTCHLSVRVRKLAAAFQVASQARVTVAQECARCLEPIERTIEPKFDMIYEEAGAAHARTEEHIRQGDLGITFFSDSEIDLSSEIKQALRLALPLKPLCREDCRGLCPRCGASLNTGECECRERGEEAHSATMGDLLKKWGAGTKAR